MKLYYIIIKYEPSHSLSQFKESLGPFGNRAEAEEAWKLYKPQTTSAWSAQATLKTIDISARDILIILLRNFGAMQDVLQSGKITDELIS